MHTKHKLLRIKSTQYPVLLSGHYLGAKDGKRTTFWVQCVSDLFVGCSRGKWGNLVASKWNCKWSFTQANQAILLGPLVWTVRLNMDLVHSNSSKIQVGCTLSLGKIRVRYTLVLQVLGRSNGFRALFCEFFFGVKIKKFCIFINQNC